MTLSRSKIWLGALILALIAVSLSEAQRLPFRLMWFYPTELQLPEPVTGSTSSVTDTSMSIAGTCDAFANINTTAYLEIDDNQGFTSPVQSTPIAITTGAGPVAITGGNFSGLPCNTSHYLRAVCVLAPDAIDLEGDTVVQSTSACTPPPTPPTAVTQAASGTTSTTTTLNGTVNPNGTASTSFFVCGTSTGNYNGCGNIASPTTSVSTGAGSSPIAASVGLNGLTPSTTYYFRVKGTNGGGTSQGSELTVTTSAAGAAPTLLTSADLTYLGRKTLNITGGANHMGLTIRYVTGVRHFLTGQDGVMSVRQWTDDGIAYGGTITNAKVTNTWAAQGVPTGAGCQGIWNGLHWDAGNTELITTNTCVYTQPNVTNIYKRTLNSDNTISNLLGPYLFTGVGQKIVAGGCITTPSALQAAWSVGPLTCGWGMGPSTVVSGGGACLGLCAFFFPALNTLTPNVSSTNFVVGSRKPYSGTDSCHLTTCGRGIRATTYDNYIDSNDGGTSNRLGGPNGLLIQVNVAANGTTVTCVNTSAPSGCYSGNNLLGRLNPASGTLSTGGGWWITQGLPVTIQGQQYALSTIDSYSQLTLASPVAGAPLTNVSMRGPSAKPTYNLTGSNWTVENGNQVFGQSDQYLGSCVWPYNGSGKAGFICFAQLVAGKYYYSSSDIWYSGGKTTEVHFFNYNHFREVQLTTRDQSQVQPVEMNTSLVSVLNSRVGLPPNIGSQTTPRGGATAAVFDDGGDGDLTDGDEQIIVMACRVDVALATCDLYYYAVDLTN